MGSHVLFTVTRVGGILDDEAALLGDGVSPYAADQLRALPAEHGTQNHLKPSGISSLALHGCVGKGFEVCQLNDIVNGSIICSFIFCRGTLGFVF